MLLHYVAMSRLSRYMIKRMIQLHPKALMKRDNSYNQLPLHYACRYNRRVAAESLAAAYPAALSMKNDDGKTPFEMIGDVRYVTVTNDEKLAFKRATLHAIMEAHFKNNQAVLGYGTEKEVSIYIEHEFQ